MNSIRVVSMLILPALFTCIVEAQCPPVQDKDKGRLIEYVQKKYKVPATMHLQVADTPLGVAACYRKLTFTSDDARSSFRLALFATPDLRFLSSELLDSSVDPIVEERQKAEALAAGLTRGDLPYEGRPMPLLPLRSSPIFSVRIAPDSRPQSRKLCPPMPIKCGSCSTTFPWRCTHGRGRRPRLRPARTNRATHSSGRCTISCSSTRRN